MVNVFAIVKPLLHLVVKLAAGIRPQTVEIEPGTVMNFWVPYQKKPNKPSVVLVHGFAADGILTWAFQVLALTKNYAVYVPDLLFFGGSTTDRPNRSPDFQAQCLAQGLRKLGVERCTLVGLSYGGMVGFKMAKLDPELVESMVVSSTVVEFTESISVASLGSIGFSRWSEFLLPETVEGLKIMLSIGTHKLPRLPEFFFKDFLEVMFNHRKERVELLEALVIPDKDSTTPNYPQRIHLLWGEDDKIFNLELANSFKEKLGDNAYFQYIEKAGHLVPLERPHAYNRQLKTILASLESYRKNNVENSDVLD